MHETREDVERYECAPCARGYPVVIGIPDFRLRPDPWIGFEDDRAKGIALELQTRDADFETTVRAYWAMTPDTPRALAERFTQFVVTAEPRATEWLEGAQGSGLTSAPWLDVGCGTADLVLAALRRGQPIVGIDIAFRWLVVARRRLQRAGFDAPLVCCNAEHLPFASGTFAHVVSLGTIEHCLDPDALVSEARRVLASDGTVSLRTVNRYSPLPEPHVGVWGVGFVPRRWADAYVRWRSGQRYEHHRPLSPRELRRGLRAVGFHRVRVTPAALLPSDRQRVGRMAAIAPLYDGLRRTPVIDRLMCWVAPLLEASGDAA
jgi:SAM-dependent methyltransferase